MIECLFEMWNKFWKTHFSDESRELMEQYKPPDYRNDRRPTSLAINQTNHPQPGSSKPQTNMTSSQKLPTDAQLTTLMPPPISEAGMGSPPFPKVFKDIVERVKEVPSRIRSKMGTRSSASSAEFDPMVVRICPFCNDPFDDSDLFVEHLRNCNVPIHREGQEAFGNNRYPTRCDQFLGEHDDPSDDNRLCPLCFQKIGSNVSQEDFERHVNGHFAHETFVDLSSALSSASSMHTLQDTGASSQLS